MLPLFFSNQVTRWRITFIKVWSRNRSYFNVRFIFIASDTQIYFLSGTIKKWKLFQFVAHPNCQQHMTSLWYGSEMGFLQSLSWWKQLCFVILFLPTIPFIALSYIIAPNTKVVITIYRCFDYIGWYRIDKYRILIWLKLSVTFGII